MGFDDSNTWGFLHIGILVQVTSGTRMLEMHVDSGTPGENGMHDSGTGRF